VEDTELGATQLGDPQATGRAQPPAASLRKGDALGRYVVLDVLGAGGMGVVYAAYDPELDRRVAIKLLRPTAVPSATGGPARGRLIREAQALARLQHPNVVTVHDVGEHDGQVFVAMEYVDGLTLREDEESHQRSWRESLEILMRAGRGLEAAHAKQLVHRDFKPDNVMLERRGDGHDVTRVLVMDFGLATPSGALPPVASVSEADSATSLSSAAMFANLTRTGAVLGTPAYMAPEQHRGAETDARTDQFSFCVTLYEALYGQRPYAGDTLPSLVANCTEGNLSPPPAGSRVPRWLRSVVVRGLSVDSAARWPTMTALLDALAKDPTRARRRRISAGLALALVGVGYGATVVAERSRVEDCRAAADSIEEVYDDETGQRVRSSLLATGLSYAPDTWSRLEPHLTARAEDWRARRFDACVTPGDLTEELVVAQVECFEASKQRFADRIDLLEHADRTVLHSAISATARETPDHCGERKHLQRRIVQTADPALRTQVLALQRDLSRCALLRQAGRYALSLELADDTLARAQELGDARTQAEAWHQHAKTLYSMHRLEEAEPEFETAFFRAREAGDDALAATVAGTLVVLVGQDLARTAEGRRWAEHARILLDVSDADELDRARFEHYMGLLEAGAGNYDAAVGHLEASLRVSEQAFGEHSIAAIHDIEALAMVYERLAQTPRAIEYFQRVLKWREETYGPNHPEVATAHNDVAAALQSTHEFEAARRHLVQAIEIFDAAGLEGSVAAPLDNLALVEREAGHLEQALVACERGLAARRNTLPENHPLIANSLINRGQIREVMGDIPAAIADYEAALRIHEQREDPRHPAVADAAYTLGIVYYRQRDSVRALEYSRRALEIYRASLPDGHPKVTAAVLAVAVAASSADDHATVIQTVQLYLGGIDESLLSAGQRCGLFYVAAKALLETDRAAEALPWARRAVEASEDPTASAYNRQIARALLARAQWDNGEDRSESRALAVDALAKLLSLGPPDPTDVETIETWLRDHPAPS
jgi:tetratricopeptide (TPR) repeat protein